MQTAYRNAAKQVIGQTPEDKRGVRSHAGSGRAVRQKR